MNTRSGWSMSALLGTVAVLGLGAAAYRLAPDLMSREKKKSNVPTFTVKKGDLKISVAESGTIQAREQVILKNEVEGRATIIYLVEEGTMVKEGDLLVELDVSDVEEQRIEREIKVENADAAMIGAREELEVVKSQAKSDISLAELNHRFAKEDLQNYLEGEYPRQLKEAESKITLALEELENANETFRWSEKLFQEKYISQTELDRDRLAQSRAKLDHELAVAALELLEEYTHTRQVDELQSNIEQTEMALERTNRSAKASIVQAEANLRAKEAEHGQQQFQLDRILRQIKNAKITAPVAGMAVHATTGKGSWRGNDEPLKEGKEVREREELIFLPVANSMMAKVNVHETSLDKVAPGQRVQITVEALPGRVFTGEVTRIAPLPDAQSVWMNPDLKIYPTEIVLDGELTELRTGMTCQAEIHIEDIEGAIYIPLQSVVRVGKQHRVYVETPTGFEPRDVTIGLDDRHMVHVKEGLVENEVVMLSPPLQDGARHIDSSGSADERPAGPDVTARDEELRGGRGGRGGGDRGDRGGRPGAEQMEEYRKRMESMSPEEIEAMKARFSGGGRPAAPSHDGGAQGSP